MEKKIPIEDEFNDIINKAMYGINIPVLELSSKSNVPIEIIKQLLRGDLSNNNEVYIKKISHILNLDPKSLISIANKEWYPKHIEVEGLKLFNSKYGDIFVNSFIVYDPLSSEGCIIDSGSDSIKMINYVNELNLKINYIFITHTHPDHVMGIENLQSEFYSAKVFSNHLEKYSTSNTFKENQTFKIGDLCIKTLTTSGHSRGGTSYYIKGLEKPVIVTGDALFSGSMGGGIVSFQDALKNTKEKILSLPDESIICPGHGPISTIREEKINNPFFSLHFKSDK